MPEFKIEDIDEIIEYVKSLDIYDQFSEIKVSQLMKITVIDERPYAVEVQIFVKDQLLYSHIEQRSFTDLTMRFDHYFEKEIKYISASAMFGQKLVRCIDEFSNYSIIEGNRAYLIVAENETKKYTLQVYLNEEEIAVSTVAATFNFEHDSFDSSHEFKSKFAVKIEDLKEVIDSFEKLKNSIVLD